MTQKHSGRSRLSCSMADLKGVGLWSFVGGLAVSQPAILEAFGGFGLPAVFHWDRCQ